MDPRRLTHSAPPVRPRRLPQAFAPLLTALARDYVQACQASGEVPDEALVSSVREVLAQQGSGPPEEAFDAEP